MIAILWVNYRLLIHKKQVPDRSGVEFLMEQAHLAADTFESGKHWKEIGMEEDEAAEYVQSIRAEVERLQDVGADGWTYYQTLHLGPLLVEINTTEEVKAEAELVLTTLADYVEDSLVPFDRRQYDKWNEHLKIITDPKNSVEYWWLKCCRKSTDEDHKLKLLKLAKCRLQALKSYLADIESNWATGTVIVSNLKYGSITTIIAFLLIAFLPVISTWCTNSGYPEFGWFGWGLLGSAGALLSVLHKQQKYDIVELGDTEGQKEFWRAFVGGCLGLVAGLIAYALIRGGVVSGRLFPSFCEEVQTCENSSLYLSLIWAIGAGFGFEKIFDRVKQTWGTNDGSYK